MKKIILFAILLLSSLAVNAQQTTSDARERLVEAKTRYMIRTLAITPAQQQRFTEIYRQYNKSMRGMWTNDNSSNGNDVNAQAQLIKQRLSKQKRAIDIQMATIDLQRPVESVSWNDCQTFVKKLSELTGENFRLPTEAEWEFAARGGNNSQGRAYITDDDTVDVSDVNALVNIILNKVVE